MGDVQVERVIYSWHVYRDGDGDLCVRVNSPDASIHLEYTLGLPTRDRFILAEGRTFSCPKFEDENGVLDSGGVSALVSWYLEAVAD